MFPDQNIQGMLRKHQASLSGWEPALSLRVPGTLWEGISCWAQLQQGPCPGFPFMATPAGRVCAAIPPVSIPLGACLILLWKKDVANRPQPPCHASCHPWQHHGVSMPCSQLGLLQELQGLSCPKPLSLWRQM